ncbi:amino acid aminotransferase [Parasphingorhabdus sp.]|uniref:amino acid aminotransferase n=1 Tax=Parasphingorhabdus sp. TaxID=2709688 RepID=UPI0032EC74ED
MTDSLFNTLAPSPPDALLALIAAFRADPRLDKIDVGIGVYRNSQGQTPVFSAVKAAEQQLAETQTTKAYLGAEGDAVFTELLAPIVFGMEHASSDRLTGVQTPGGTGALRLGAELIARATPDARVWIGTPTWPNHAPIFSAAGLLPTSHAYWDASRGRKDFGRMMAALEEVAAGDILLLHGCCHNPTGSGFSLPEWQEIAKICNSRKITPFIDLAYQGLGDGLDEDAAGLRLLLSTVDEALIAYSCDKNFGLYRERVGALWIQAGSSKAVSTGRSAMLALARALWSMPPDHGAAIVRTILENGQLERDWQRELAGMRARLGEVRAMLAAIGPVFAPIGEQRGLFALLPLAAGDVAELRETYAIYLAPDGRANLAGLGPDTIARFAAAVLTRIAISKA